MGQGWWQQDAEHPPERVREGVWGALYLPGAEGGVGGLEQGLGAGAVPQHQEGLGAGGHGGVGGDVLVCPLQAVVLGYPEELQLCWEVHGLRGVPVTLRYKDNGL